MRIRLLPLLLVVSLGVNAGLSAAIYTVVTTRDALSVLLGRPQPRADIVTCWGDSLTAGAGANVGHDFPHMVGATLGREVFNGGVGSETSTQIKHRMLARAAGLDKGVTIIWAGHNYEDSEVVQANVAAMVTSLPVSARYLVLGIVNGDVPEEARGQSKYELITELNGRLASTYGDRYLPVREYLISMFNPHDVHDIDDKARDIVPASLRTDPRHLNNTGYALVAAYIVQNLVIRGW
jgi:lysophospholipase L1-like esterase